MANTTCGRAGMMDLYYMVARRFRAQDGLKRTWYKLRNRPHDRLTDRVWSYAGASDYDRKRTTQSAKFCIAALALEGFNPDHVKIIMRIPD